MKTAFKTKNKRDRSSVLLIYLCWLVYACAYVGRGTYAANINPVMDYYSVNHADAGLVSTAFFFAYGIGQVINGLFCKKYNIRWIIFGCLMLSGAVNLAIVLLPGFAPIKYLWIINLSGALCNVALNFALIPIWGVPGAAVASLITKIVTNVFTGFIIKPIRKNNILMLRGLNPKLIVEMIKTSP